MLDAQYGAAGAALIRAAGLLERPLRLAVNRRWDDKVDGRWQAPRAPLLAVPLNMTSGQAVWERMDAAIKWAREWVPGNVPVLKGAVRRRRRLAGWQRLAAP